MTDRFRLACFKRVNLAVNLFKLLPILRVRIDAAACCCDGLEGVNVERVFTRRGRIPDRNGMDGDALVFRNLRRCGWRHLTGRIVAVRESDENAFLDRTAVEHIDGQRERITERRLRAGHLDLCFVEQLAADFQILGERSLDKRRTPKKDQAHSIALSSGQKIVKHSYCLSPRARSRGQRQAIPVEASRREAWGCPAGLLLEFFPIYRTFGGRFVAGGFNKFSKFRIGDRMLVDPEAIN